MQYFHTIIGCLYEIEIHNFQEIRLLIWQKNRLDTNFVYISFRYPTSIAALSFSADSAVLAIATSYMYENDDQKTFPEDHIYIRNVSDQETKPK